MANKTVTVRPSGGDYTSLSAAITGEVAANANLVTMAGILTIRIEGTWSSADTTSVDLNGFTTNSSYYVNIITDSSNKAGTSWSDSKYRLALSTANQCLVINDSYSRITGLQIANSNINGTSTISMNATYGLVDSCYITGSQRPIRVETGGDYGAVINSIAITKSTASAIRPYSTNCYIYNCVAISGNYGIYCSGTGNILKNCYAYGATADDYTSGTKTTCASADTTGSTGLQSIAYSTANFTNVTSGSEDLSLPLDSALIGVGTDLRSDATWPFDYDIMGTARGSTWDVGAFEYVSSGIVATGIASGEAIGSASLSVTIESSGIATSESIGSHGVSVTISGTGIATGQAIGSPSVGISIVSNGITSGQAIGSPSLSVGITSSGIATGQAIGQPIISVATPGTIACIGISSNEAIGSSSLTLNINNSGIASGEALGSPSVDNSYSIIVTGINSSEAVGTSSISVELNALGITSSMTVGNPRVGSTLPGLMRVTLSMRTPEIIATTKTI